MKNTNVKLTVYLPNRKLFINLNIFIYASFSYMVYIIWVSITNNYNNK